MNLENMNLITKICIDIEFFPDKEKIIRKYLLPLLIENPEALLELDPQILGNIFNILEKEEIEKLTPSINTIIGDFDISEFLEIKWKIGKCSQCSQTRNLIKCKGEHDDDCPYIECISNSCSKLYCENCIFHICSNEFPDCPAIRCESCSEFID
jgi:hypothetical protein